MTLTLDARQRAMLEEMGTKVWLPLPEPEAAPAEAPTPTQAPRATAAPRMATPSIAEPPSAPSPPNAAPMAGSGLRATAPQRLYAADDQPATGGWLVVVDLPPAADGRHDSALRSEAGRLLDQMLRALRLQAGPLPVHLVRVWRGAAGLPAAVGEDTCTEGLLDSDFDGWVAPLAPRLVLALGPLAAQRLLGRQAPLGRLRGSMHAVAIAGTTRPVVASYPPAYLLRNGADKARAWADLCLAADCIANAS